MTDETRTKLTVLISAIVERVIDEPEFQDALEEFLQPEADETTEEETGETPVTYTGFREVWRQKSEQALITRDAWHNITLSVPGPAYLVLTARYHDTEKVGIIEACAEGHDPRRLGNFPSIANLENPSLFPKIIARKVIDASDYTQVILEAQRFWDEAYQIWLDGHVVKEEAVSNA